MGQSILGAQRANRKGSRAVSFGGGEEAEESNSSALDLGVGFQIRDLVLSLLTLPCNIPSYTVPSIASNRNTHRASALAGLPI